MTKNTPTPRIGYAHVLDGSDWRTSCDDDWDCEIVGETELAGAVYVGTRLIDTYRCRVFLTTAGTYFAQTIPFCR